MILTSELKHNKTDTHTLTCAALAHTHKPILSQVCSLPHANISSQALLLRSRRQTSRICLSLFFSALSDKEVESVSHSLLQKHVQRAFVSCWESSLSQTTANTHPSAGTQTRTVTCSTSLCAALGSSKERPGCHLVQLRRFGHTL